MGLGESGERGCFERGAFLYPSMGCPRDFATFDAKKQHATVGPNRDCRLYGSTGTTTERRLSDGAWIGRQIIQRRPWTSASGKITIVVAQASSLYEYESPERTNMWQDIEGHDDIVERFRQTLRKGRLASTYLFVGPAGIGKRLFATRLAKALLCTEARDDELEPCQVCESCRLLKAGNHPDLLAIGLPAEKSVLPIDLFIGDRQHRHQNGLCHDLSLKPFLSGRRIAVIDDADHLSRESANCLLKTLEEPPPHSLLILIGTSPSRQLPTIRSRSQMVRFRPLSDEIVARLLVKEGIVDDTISDNTIAGNNTISGNIEAAHQLAPECQGSLQRARELADPELGQIGKTMAQWLSRSPLDTVQIAQGVATMVESAGKEAKLRRARLRLILRVASEVYRREMLGACSDAAAGGLDHCLSALEYVDRNANQTTLIHWWASGLTSAQIPSHGMV